MVNANLRLRLSKKFCILIKRNCVFQFLRSDLHSSFKKTLIYAIKMILCEKSQEAMQGQSVSVYEVKKASHKQLSDLNDFCLSKALNTRSIRWIPTPRR